jgi:glycosyltransferase involved in cell wall biosynthesis
VSRPWLSVVMPTYNGERYLRDTFASLVEQDERGFECVVVDGGSTDGTRAIIDEFARELDVRVFVRPEFPNWVGKTNFAFAEAAAEHVCMLHSDDRWMPGRATAARRALGRHPDVALVLNPSLLIDQDGRTVGRWRCPLDPEPTVYSPNRLLEHLVVQNFVAIPAPIFRRDAALSVGGIDSELWYTGDWDFYLKLARTGNTLYLDEMLTAFRIHGASLTMKGSANVEAFRAQLELVLERHLPAIESAERRRAVRRVGAVSNEIDIALAAAVHGSWSALPGAFVSLAALGPAGWHSYFRDSRIHERVASRLRARGSLFAMKKGAAS